MNTEKMQGVSRRMLPTAVMAAVLVLSACSSKEDNADVLDPPATLTFDMRHGGYSQIFVYPGTSESEADRTHNDVYVDGQQVPIACHQKGRWVYIKPEQGEGKGENLGDGPGQRPVSSDDWYKLAGRGAVEFATGTYATIEPHRPIPECPVPSASATSAVTTMHA